jgi:hypothetical protein
MLRQRITTPTNSDTATMKSPYIIFFSPASEYGVGQELAFLQPTPTANDLVEDRSSSFEFSDHYSQAIQENEYRHIFDPQYWEQGGVRQEEEDEAHSPSRTYHEAGERQWLLAHWEKFKFVADF